MQAAAFSRMAASTHGDHSPGHDARNRPRTIKPTDIAIRVRIYLDKIRNLDIQYSYDGISFPLAHRREDERLPLFERVRITTCARIGGEANFSYFNRPQPIEKSRFVEIKGNKKEIKGNKKKQIY